MSKDFEKWKEDWEENWEEFESGQSELFRNIRDKHNLEKKIERAVEESVKDLSERIADAVYSV
jgi:broad specificity phosphatase PhoE